MAHSGNRFEDDTKNLRTEKEQGERDYAEQREEASHAGEYIAQALRRLDREGIELGSGYYSVPPAARNILVAEAVNLAAKEIDSDFYNLKPDIFIEAAVAGKDHGVTVYYRKEDSTWNIHHDAVGIVSFHDPNGAITLGLEGKDVAYAKDHYPWSGIRRQQDAFEHLKSERAVRRAARLNRPKYEAEELRNAKLPREEKSKDEAPPSHPSHVAREWERWHNDSNGWERD